jgi:importin-4
LRTDYLSKPECLLALINILCKHENPQIRQLAAVEARQIVPKYWITLPANDKVQIREALLQATRHESVSIVKNNAARVVSSIAKLDLPDGEWGDLIAFLYQASTSANAADREVGTYVLYTVLESLEEDIVGQWKELFELFSRTIKDPESLQVRLNTLLSLGKLGEFLSTELPDAVKAYQQALPLMVEVLKDIVSQDDEKKANQAFEVFQTLLIVESALINAHFKDLLIFFMDLASNKNIDDGYRTKAISFLMSCLRYKKLKVQGLKFGPDLTLRALEIATEFKEEEEEEEMSPSRNSLAILDYLSASLPPSQVIVPLLNALPQYINNQDPAYRRAAILALGYTVEGAPDFVSSQMPMIFPLVLRLLSDPVPDVRKATLGTIARLADDLPEEIGAEHAKLIPLLVQIIDTAENVETMSRACDAIEAALVGVNQSDVVAYLPELMPRLSKMFTQDDFKLKSSAIASIGSAASAAGEAFLPYFQDTMNAVSPFVGAKDSEEQLDLRGIIIESLCSIANAVGGKAFTPYVEPLMESAKEGLHLNHPRLKETSFSFFSAMARVYEEDFQPFLETVVPALFESLEQEESDMIGDDTFDDLVVNSVGAEGTEKVAIDGTIDLDIGDDDDGDEDDLWEELDTVNALALEKEVAADTLGEVLSNCKRGFIPYLTKTVEILAMKTQHPYEGVRANAVATLWRAFATFWQINEDQMQKWVPGLPLAVRPPDDVIALRDIVVKCTLDLWKEEVERVVVSEICNNIAATLKFCGPVIIQEQEALTEMATQIVLLLQKKHVCQQDIDEDEADQQDIQEDSAELDWQLIEGAMDLCVGLSAALGPQFVNAWQPFGPTILRYASSSEPRERATAVGIIADCVKHMGDSVDQYTPQLFKLFLHRLTDEDARTKSHAAYAMGMLALKTDAKAEIIASYPEILEKLGPLLQVGTAAKSVGNAAGCIARMILAAPNSVNLEQTLSALFDVLPLTADFEENEPIYEMIIKLYQANNQVIFQLTTKLLPAFNTVLGTPKPGEEEQITQEIRSQLVELVKFIHGKDSNLVGNFPNLVKAL